MLHIAPSHARRDGGPSEVLRGLLPAIASRGIDLELISTTKHLARGETGPLGIRTTLAPSAGPASLNFARGFRRLVRSRLSDVDVAHIHSVNTYTTSVAMAECHRAGIPFLIQPHGAWDRYHLAEGALKKAVYTRLFDARSLLHCAGAVYSSTRETHDGMTFAPSIPAFLVELGVERSLFAVPRAPDPVRTVLFLGRVAKKKRLDLLLEAMATDAGRLSGFHLIVAGPIDNDLPEHPHSIVERLGIAPRVQFFGPATSEQRGLLLASTSAFVLASDDESFGMAVAEAMAAGVPTVVSSNVGIADAAAAAGAVELTTQTPGDVARSVTRLLDDPAAAHSLSSAARAYALEHFTWERSAESSESAYRALVA